MTTRKFKLYFKADNGAWFASVFNLEKGRSAYALIRYANCRIVRGMKIKLVEQ